MQSKNSLRTLYQDYDLVGAREIFVTGKGWIPVCCTMKEDTLSFSEGTCADGEVGRINIALRNQDGFYTYIDVTPEELKQFA
jgi:hypothetical protein